MKLELEVLASTSIRRKKPWPRLAWVGESQESIFLLDEHRVSVLYVPSGKTRRRVPKLQSHLQDLTALNHSDNGHFMVGLLRSGDLFLWHKDTDMLKNIKGLPELAQMLPNMSNNANRPAIPIDPPKPHICIADDGSKIVVVMNRTRLYVWEKDADQILFAAKSSAVKGSWTEVRPSRAVSFPDPSSRETAVSAVFFINDALGLCCLVSYVFTVEDSVCVTTAVIRWYEHQHIMTYSKPTVNIEWTDIHFKLSDLAPGGSPVRAGGAYVARPSHDGQLLSVAVNQKNSSLNRILFLSPLTDTVVVSDLRGMGARVPVTRDYKTYWVTELAWTADDLFTIVMTKQGSIAMVTRLGEPVLLKTFGCSLDMGPRYYLPLHPVISVKAGANEAVGGDNTQEYPDYEAQAAAESDPMRQRFSISCHPRLPIFLCSDGYMVTAMQLPADLSCLSLMKGLLMESNRHLRRLRDQQKLTLTLYDSMRRQGRVTKKLSLSNGVAGGRRISGVKHVKNTLNVPYRFEAPEEDALNHSLDEDEDVFSPFGASINITNMESGKLFFGDLENLNMTTELDVTALEESLDGMQPLLDQVQKSLLLAWSLAASHCGVWTEDHEEVTTNVAHNLVRLFSIILQSSDDVLRELLVGNTPITAEEQKNPRVGHVLRLVTSLLQLLRLDVANQHLMVCGVRFVQSTIRLLLTDPHLLRLEPRLTTLHGGFILLTFIERAFSAIYTPLPKTSMVNSIPGKIQREFVSIFEPPTLCEYLAKRAHTPPAADVLPRYEMSGNPPEQKKLIRPLPEEENGNEPSHRSEIIKRLGPAWKLLYKHTVVLFKTILTKKVKANVHRAVHHLLISLQVKLASTGQDHFLAPNKKYKVQPGSRLSIEGCSVPALKAWMYQLHMPKEAGSENGMVGRLLLSTLYSMLLQDELRAAIEFTELLLRQPDVRTAAATCRQDQAKKWNILAKLQQDTGSTSPPQYIQNDAVRAVVRSIGRIMAAYFSNMTLFVFPPHSPKSIPPLHRTYNLKHRVIPLYHESLASVVRQDGLGGVWTVERAADYLLIAGLVPEAIWFADALGDWKTAYTLGVAHSEHQRALPNIYSSIKKKLEIPRSIQPDTVLQKRLVHSFGLKTNSKGGLLVDEETDLPALRRILADLMLAAVLSQVDLVPFLMEGLVERLRIVTAQFPPIVPPGLYLPAPPVYCPQPANTSQAQLTEEDSQEIALRREASSLIQLMFLVLEGANCTLPSARWYAQHVNEALSKGQRFKSINATALSGPDVPVLQSSFIQYESTFSGREDDPSVHRILAAYRDFCTLVWLLYVRDKLSLGLRKKLQLVERKMKRSPVPHEAWLKHCQETLHWAACLMPFAHFMGAENDIFGITLSLITELPPDEHACQLLCQFFYDAESLDPELQDKLQSVLKDWQGVFIDPPHNTPRSEPREAPKKSPRGTSLSFYFHKQAQRMEKHFRRKAKVFGEYEVFVFDSETEQKEKEEGITSNGLYFIGSRPFESEHSFLEFLDVFYAVSFHKCLDVEEKEPTTPLPLLSANSAAFREKELMSLTHKAVTSLHRKQQMVSTASSPRHETPESTLSKKSLTTVTSVPSRSRLPSSPRGKVGLFRSRSFSELSQKRGNLPPSSPLALRKKSSSHQDLTMLSADEDDFLEVHTSKPRPKTLSSSLSEAPRTGSRYAQTRQLSGSDTQLTVDGVVPKMTLAGRINFRRSSSVNDVDEARKEREQTKSKTGLGTSMKMPAEDPLLKPVVSSSMLDQLEFGKSFAELEQLLEWLARWGGRNHTLNSRAEQYGGSLSDSLQNLSQHASPAKGAEFSFNNSLKIAAPELNSIKQRPAMRIKVHPRMIVYSLWLVENQYYRQLEPPGGVRVEDPGGVDNKPLTPPTKQEPPLEAKHPTVRPPSGSSSQLNATTTSLDTADTITPLAPGLSTSTSTLHTQEEFTRDAHVLEDQYLGEGYLDDEQQELEESYRQQIISAESNESLSDGFIPESIRKKKMGILKKKKKKEKKAKEPTPAEVLASVQAETGGVPVSTSDTLMRRLSFNLSENRPSPPVEPAVQSHNASQVSDSTLNVSSLNEEELPDTMRHTLTQLDRDSTKKLTAKTPSKLANGSQKVKLVTRPEVHAISDDPDARLLDEMAEPAIDTRLDLRRLESAPANEDPDDLRSMVRQELRKIVTAQHRGILAMLGALGEDEEAPLGSSTPHDRNPRQKERRHSGKKKTPRGHDARRHEQLAFNLTQDTSFNDPSSLTEVDVTPLPSDEASLKSLDRPLTVSDLFRSKTWSPGARFEAGGVGNNVRGALRELKTLENSQSPNHVHFDLEQSRLAQTTGAQPNHSHGVQPPSGKENVHIGQEQSQGQYQQAFMGTHPNQYQQQHPNNMNDSTQPFSRVFNMLKQMNQDLAMSNSPRSHPGGFGGSTDPGPRPPLLHIPPGPGVRFPAIAVQSGATPTRGPPTGAAPGSRMPLLHLYTPHHTDEVPVRDMNGHLPRQQAPPIPFRMPLLRMNAPPSHPRIFQHIEDEQGELQLAPADEVLAFEARRQEERRIKLEQRRKQMEALGLSGPPVEAMLKKAERRDQRQTERRKQRRQRAEDDDKVQTSRENLSTTIQLSRQDTDDSLEIEQPPQMHSQHVQVEGPEMTTQEVQVTYTPTPREYSTQGMQFPTPRTGSLDQEEEEDEEEAGHMAGIHHGYALTPGLFDEYLTRDGELGTAQDNSARLHYRATAGQRQRKLKEQSTETDGPGWSETGTITCRDQGTDPVAEALEDYVQSRKNLKAGGYIAPDVFMGLQFSEDGQTASASGTQGGAPKRAFINVVDLDEAALADIVTSLPERDQSARGVAKKSPRKEKKSSLRRKPEARHVRLQPEVEEEESEESQVGPDRVTSRMFSVRQDDASRIDSSGPASHRARAYNKDSIRDRLGNMDMQFEAIEAMSRNMEEDYKNARLMIHTIEKIGEAVQASVSLSEDESAEPEEQPTSARQSPKRTLRTPRESPKSRQQEKSLAWAEEETTQMEEHPEALEVLSALEDEEGLSQLERTDEMEDMPDEESRPEPGIRASAETSGLNITGLSGVSDIIGEVIASGRIDTAGLGISARQAKRLADKAGVSELKRNAMEQKVREEQEARKAAEEKERLRAWMEDKRKERFSQFKERQDKLREAERSPYKAGDDSAQMSTMTFKEMDEWGKNRVSNKKEQEIRNAERRLQEASELMGDILSEKPAVVTQDSPTRPSARKTVQSARGSYRGASSSPSRRNTSTSPARRGASRSPARNAGPRMQSARKVSPNQRPGHNYDNEGYRNDMRNNGRTFSGPQDLTGTGHGRTLSGGLLNTQTGTSSAGLRAYTQHLENVNDSAEPDSQLQDTAEYPEPGVDQKPPQPSQAYKPKPFTEKVRLQRPEATRGDRPHTAAKPYVQRLSETSQANSTPRSASANRRAQERLYGTKRIPGTQDERTAPRTVKSYQERLREMKQARVAQPGPIRRYTGPLPGPGGATSTPPARRPMKRITKKKPLTYSQQLKALQPPKELYRTGTMDSSMLNRSGNSTMGRGRGRHKPPHKPMTYQEQLQKLQPPKELFRTPPPGKALFRTPPTGANQYQDGPSFSRQTYQSTTPHQLRRSGPYPTPYRPNQSHDMEDHDVDRASQMSPWDMDDNIRRLLYEDGASSYVGASRTGTDLDLEELQDLAGLDSIAYTDLVGLQDLEDVASVSEGSIMSFIDWDQVNDLIADVH